MTRVQSRKQGKHVLTLKSNRNNCYKRTTIVNDSLDFILIVQARPFCALCIVPWYIMKKRRDVWIAFFYLPSAAKLEKLPFLWNCYCNVALFVFAFDLFPSKVEQALSFGSFLEGAISSLDKVTDYIIKGISIFPCIDFSFFDFRRLSSFLAQILSIYPLLRFLRNSDEHLNLDAFLSIPSISIFRMLH